MLTNLHLTNFRGFEDHEIPLRPLTVVVGKNNAGKSTIIEALTLVSLVAKRYQSLQFSEAPHWLLSQAGMGISPSMRDLDISLDGSVFHRYSRPPATIKATYDSGEIIRIHIGPDSHIYSEITTGQGHPVWSKSQTKRLDLPQVSVLPPIGPLAHTEKYLSHRHVIKHYMSSLGSLHFRNQLSLADSVERDEFKKLAERSWIGLHINEVELINEENKYFLMVQDGDFVAEVGWMGHGLQMWLQVMWFLARSSQSPTVVLDEPDVYMHPDLQRRLVRLVRGRHRQVIVATHSVEIMSEVSPEEILVVERVLPQSVFAGSVPAVQTAIEELGGLASYQASKLTSASRFLVVEGDDRDMLREFYYATLSESADPFDSIPYTETGGWGNLKYAVGSSKALRKANGESVTTYCIMDRDYHTVSEIQKKLAEASRNKVQLHIWQRKEIENYLLIPELIHRFISSRMPTGLRPPTTEDILTEIDRITDRLKTTIFDAMAHEFYAEDRNRGIPGANQMVRQVLDPLWETRDGRLTVVGGKAVLKQLSSWSKSKFGVSFSDKNLARTLQRSDLPTEVLEVMSALGQGVPFPPRGN